MAQTQQTVFDNNDIQTLKLSDSRCELDNQLLGFHKWVELDKLGYVINCSEGETVNV